MRTPNKKRRTFTRKIPYHTREVLRIQKNHLLSCRNSLERVLWISLRHMQSSCDTCMSSNSILQRKRGIPNNCGRICSIASLTRWRHFIRWCAWIQAHACGKRVSKYWVNYSQLRNICLPATRDTWTFCISWRFGKYTLRNKLSSPSLCRSFRHTGITPIKTVRGCQNGRERIRRK